MAERYDSLAAALQAVHPASLLSSQSRVGGGDINEAYVLHFEDGTSLFMKQNRKSCLPFFETEIRGLEAMRQTHTIQIPKLFGYGTDGIHAFLLMECLDGARRIPGFWDVFARELADMHKAPTEALITGFGFPTDNFIGSTPQVNQPCDSWIEFFRSQRLLPMIERTKDYFDEKELRQLYELAGRVSEFLVEPIKPSLLHGDLWAGNFMTGPDGKAWLIDPATYVGHAEADIAMTELFGGFPSEFYRAYRKYGLMQEGYEKRRNLYNLYHLLNHVHLFGYGYVPQVNRIVHQYLKS